MKRKIKKTSFADLLVLVALCFGFYLCVTSISSMLDNTIDATQETIVEFVGDDCKLNRKWHLKDYKIEETRCLGLEGPAYYQFNLYNRDILISENSLSKDTCLVEFIHEQELVSVNICKEQMQVAQLADSIGETLNANLR
ncbi:hypothetical protein ACFQ1Q_08840 [Winogradskyella litorisediminis]|uniref:Uncharacterized protein n=1 Tax=Winogradskyella litorisediminis TaxID=1156618 RepID=A0ABW3N8U7_9FLAO